MATTDAKSGFRLPWTSDRNGTDEPESDASAEAAAPKPTADAWPSEDELPQPAAEATADPTTGGDAPDATDAPAAAAEPESAPTAAPSPPARGGARKPTKFLADLTKAMQAAAEESRGLTLTQFQAEAKSAVEQIHERSATQAAALRRAADDDVAGIREWSKAEIARIREETETKITERKGRLESEIEDHAAVIEREVERVHGAVSAFEAEMAAFFERLLAEDDPTRFATMAENLPEPPRLEDIVETSSDAASDEAVGSAFGADEAETEPKAEATATGTVELADDDASVDEASAAGDAPMAVDEHGGEPTELDREAAFAAIQAAAEAAASAEVASDAAARAEAVAEVIEIVGPHEGGSHAAEDDEPAPDFDAAEAEAFASADATDGSAEDGEELPAIADETLAARLAGLLPTADESGEPVETRTTQVVVLGLVSVASIAGFKRHLGRLEGVTGVGVSSGPDGEFVFAVTHQTSVVLRESIPSIPGFQARVTSADEGSVHVTASDPESAS